MTFYFGIKKGKHHTQHARVRIKSANGYTADFSAFQFPDMFGGEAIGWFVEDQIPAFRFDQQFNFRRTGRTGFLFQGSSKHRARGIDITGENATRKSPGIASNTFNKLRRRIKGSLHIYDEKSAMR